LTLSIIASQALPLWELKVEQVTKNCGKQNAHITPKSFNNLKAFIPKFNWKNRKYKKHMIVKRPEHDGPKTKIDTRQ